jgi:hypothetical protein
VSIYNVKNFLGASPRTPFKGERREGKGKREEGSIPQIKFYNYSTGRYHGPGKTSVHCAITVIAT